ncbi:MAG: helix-turn-helix domain-containing protein [Candidatus Omnitrophota bacterium]|nr:helix-turn-helix domain-containing protein [Candidatus Omnitrophota bacterium]
MRAEERSRARLLREQGCSVREIAKKINCAKSSVSGWVRGISLTNEQIRKLKANQDKGRAKAANHPNSPKQTQARIRNEIIKFRAKDIPAQCSIDLLKIVGSALYWAEGYKASLNMVNFSNTDPYMISIMMKFFRIICKVPEKKFRGAVHMHPSLDSNKAERFWSLTSGIPIAQFHKTQFGISRASKHKRKTLPFGTFAIIVCDTNIRCRIEGWIQGIKRWVNLRAVGAIG